MSTLATSILTVAAVITAVAACCIVAILHIMSRTLHNIMLDIMAHMLKQKS